MLAGMRHRGLDPAPLLAAAGIDLAESATRVPIDRYADLYNRVTLALDDEGFGLFARPLAPGFFEFLCRGMLGSGNLGQALDRAARFLRLTLPEIALRIESDPSRPAYVTLVLHETQPLGDKLAPWRNNFGRNCVENDVEIHAGSSDDDPRRVFAFEWLLRLLHGLACWLVGRGLALEEVDFPYARPAHAEDYALVYTAQSNFNAPALRARLQASLLELPLRRDELALERFLDGAPGKISMLYRRDREMVLRVRDVLRDALPENPGIEDVAARLHLAPRTLARRLSEEGSSFRRIKEALRRDLAISRLRKSRESIGRIASELGYADPSAFYRAFVSWTGVSPEHYRSRL